MAGTDAVTKALAEANNKLTDEVKALQAENAKLKAKVAANKEKKQQAAGDKPAKKAKAPEATAEHAPTAEKGASKGAASADVSWLMGSTVKKAPAPSTERKCSQCKLPLSDGGHEKCREAMKKKRAAKEDEEEEDD